MQLNRIELEIVRNRSFRAVANCTACEAMLHQGPVASYEHLAAFALGISMGIDLTDASQILSTFHLGPACPGGSMRITIEELTVRGDGA